MNGPHAPKEAPQVPELIPITKVGGAGTSAPVTLPKYDRSALTVGMAHIGVGNFHRVHQATYLEELLHLRDDQTRWGILGIELLEDRLATHRAHAFSAQDNLYSFTSFSPEGEQRSRVNASMVRYLWAPRGPAAVAQALADPALKVVTLTVTEGGYNLDEHTGDFDLSNAEISADLRRAHPRTTFGILTAALKARRDAGYPLRSPSPPATISVPTATPLALRRLATPPPTTRPSPSGFGQRRLPQFHGRPHRARCRRRARRPGSTPSRGSPMTCPW